MTDWFAQVDWRVGPEIRQTWSLGRRNAQGKTFSVDPRRTLRMYFAGEDNQTGRPAHLGHTALAGGCAGPEKIVASCFQEEWTENGLLALCRSGYPYRELPRTKFDHVVEVLLEGFTLRQGRQAAFLHRDGIDFKVEGRRGAPASLKQRAWRPG